MSLVIWHPDVPTALRVQYGATVDDWVAKRGYSSELRACLYGPVRPYHISRADIPMRNVTLRRSPCVRLDNTDARFWLIEIPDPVDLETARQWAAETQEAAHDL